MDKRLAVTIRPTENGYMVAPADAQWTSESVMVFESIEKLTAWVAVHFSKAEPVKAPESRCPHFWHASSFGKDRYCMHCGEREPV